MNILKVKKRNSNGEVETVEYDNVLSAGLDNDGDFIISTLKGIDVVPQDSYVGHEVQTK